MFSDFESTTNPTPITTTTTSITTTTTPITTTTIEQLNTFFGNDKLTDNKPREENMFETFNEKFSFNKTIDLSFPKPPLAPFFFIGHVHEYHGKLDTLIQKITEILRTAGINFNYNQIEFVFKCINYNINVYRHVNFNQNSSTNTFSVEFHLFDQNFNRFEYQKIYNVCINALFKTYNFEPIDIEQFDPMDINQFNPMDIN